MLRIAAIAALIHGGHAHGGSVFEQAGVSCTDPNSAEGLSMAVDAAIMELVGTKGWFHKLRMTSGYENAMSVFSCTPDATKWKYPDADTATGALARVLSSGKIRVAGVQWSVPGKADYVTNPEDPSGFWPEYMAAIATKIGEHYGKTIAVERIYFENSILVVDAVATGADVDMSEPYYYLSGFHVSDPRIESLAFSCVTAATASKFITQKGSGITSTDLLFDKISAGPNRAVGFIGQGNYDSVSSLLPESTSPYMGTNATDLERNVLAGSIVAGYVSEGSSNMSAFEVFETGIISPRVALFHKDSYTCETVLMPATVAIAIVVLILAILLLLIIVRERQRKPLFMPLLKETTVESVKPQL